MLRSFQGQAWCLQHSRQHAEGFPSCPGSWIQCLPAAMLHGRVHTAHLNSLVTEGFAKSGVRFQATTAMARIIAIWLWKAWHCYMSSWRCYSSKCLQEPWESRLQADKVVKSLLYNILKMFTKLQMSLWVNRCLLFMFSNALCGESETTSLAVPQGWPEQPWAPREQQWLSNSMEISNPEALNMSRSQLLWSRNFNFISQAMQKKKKKIWTKSACKIDQQDPEVPGLQKLQSLNTQTFEEQWEETQDFFTESREHFSQKQNPELRRNERERCALYQISNMGEKFLGCPFSLLVLPEDSIIPPCLVLEQVW